MVDHGLFADERIELLEGALYEMSPESDEHAWVIRELTWLLSKRLSDGWRVSVGHPWAAGERSQPEPDLAIVPAMEARVHPSSALLLVEVAGSSRQKDLGLKAEI